MTETEPSRFGIAKFAGFLMKAMPNDEASGMSEWMKGVTIRESNNGSGGHTGLVAVTEQWLPSGSPQILLVVDSEYFSKADLDSSPLGDFALLLNARRKLFEQNGWTLMLMNDVEVSEVLSKFESR